MVAATDFVEIYVIFHNVPTLGGLDAAAAFLVFGLGTLAFALANALFGELDTVPTFIRTGTLEVMLLRPMPLLAQIVTGDVRLKRDRRGRRRRRRPRLGLTFADVRWTPATVVLLVLSPLSGAAVFGALFVVAGAVQFWLVDAAEVTNGFTYGSSYASRYSGGALPLPVRLFFAFVVPASFTAYLPTLAILGLPGPPWLPLARLVHTGGGRGGLGGGLDPLAPRDPALHGSARCPHRRRDQDTETVRRGRRGWSGSSAPARRPWPHRRRGALRAVDDVTFALRAGETVGYIGANGAGKSTTIKMLTGILTPTAGRVRTCGLEPVRHRRRLAAARRGLRPTIAALVGPAAASESLHILARSTGSGGPARRPSGRTRRAARPGGLPRPPGPTALARPAHAGRTRGGVAALARAHRAGRADGRPGRAQQGTAAALPRRSTRRTRTHAAAHHARHGRRRTALPPTARRRPRPSCAYDGDQAGLVARVGARRVLVVDLAEPTRRSTPSPTPYCSASRAAAYASGWRSRPDDDRGRRPRRRQRGGRRARPVRRRARHRGRRPPPLRVVDRSAASPCGVAHGQPLPSRFPRCPVSGTSGINGDKPGKLALATYSRRKTKTSTRSTRHFTERWSCR